MGADQDLELPPIKVVQGEESDDDSDDGDEDEEMQDV
jgi:hypothetical protein